MRDQTKLLFQKLCEVIPGGVNSAARAFKGLDMDPLIAAKGEGDEIIDVEGRRYIDFCCGWGALILGHAAPHIVEAAIKRVRDGSLFSVSSEVEYEIAAKVVSHYPSIEKVRFLSSGTEATMTAARLARGATGRTLIVKFEGNYHGHSDLFLIKAGSAVTLNCSESSSRGVPKQETIALPYNDTESFCEFMRQKGDEVAGVIVEPIAGNMGVVPGKPQFLQALRNETARYGTILIFDEVISGYRVSLSGAQGLYGIDPDLTTLGKIVGGGFPAAAVGGKASIMDLLPPLGDVFQAGTLSGNPVAMQAGLETLKTVEKPGFYDSLEEKVRFFLEGLDDFCINRVGSMFTLFLTQDKVDSFDDLKETDWPLFKRFYHTLFEEGIYIPQSPYEAWFISNAHTEEHLRKARDVIKKFAKSLQNV